jgi:alkylation response protein AidB-like acyl-CoA dehydrogenase
MRPLEGIRVLEIGQYIAGPYCAMLLADQGAEVIEFERPSGGDPRRKYDPRIEGDGGHLSGGFLSYNRDKKSVTIDLSTSLDRQVVVQVSRVRGLVAGRECGDGCPAGFGFAAEYDLERRFRESRLCKTAPISNNLAQAFVGQHVLGLPKSD